MADGEIGEKDIERLHTIVHRFQEAYNEAMSWFKLVLAGGDNWAALYLNEDELYSVRK